jgi:drug/metabolite transporter (DMT)-like permease
VGALYLIISGAAFGLLPWFARTAYDHGADPLGMLLGRFILAALGMLLVRSFRPSHFPWPSKKLFLQLFALGAAGYAIQSSFYFYGVQRIDISLGTVIFYSYPVMVVLTSWAVFKQKPSLRMTVCLSVVVCGVALTAGQVKAGTYLGVFAMLMAAITYTAYILVSSKITRKAGAFMSLTIVMIGASFGHGITWPLHQASLPQDTIGWLATIGAALFSTVIAMGFFFAGVARLNPGEAAVLSTTEPVVTIAVGVLALGEVLTASRFVGAVAVLLGVAVLAQLSRADTK